MKISIHLSIIGLVLGFALNGQNVNKAGQPGGSIKQNYIKNQGYLAKSGTSLNNMYGDSLKGFDEVGLTQFYLNSGLGGAELVGHMERLKRDFINNKYGLATFVPSPYKTIGGLPQLGNKKKGGSSTVNVAPCVNEGFEQTAPGAYSSATAVTGWTIESRSANSTCTFTDWASGSNAFAIVATPLTNWPWNGSPMGIIPHSPLGGTVVAQLNDANNNNSMVRIRQTFPVTQTNALFQFAYAGYWQDGGSGHGCCDQPGINVKMYDCSGAPLACVSLSLFPGQGCQSTGVTYTLDGSTGSWTNWQVKFVDFTPYIGTCITVEFMTTDCSFGGHWGTTLLDVMCGGQNIGTNLPPTSGGTIAGPVSFCAGSNVAVITAPTGYATYQWISPITGTVPAPQGTMSALTVSNPVPGSVYTVNLVTASGCMYVSTNTIVFSQVNIAGLGSSPSCPNGSSGSATVAGNGSGAGYTYTWVNTSSQVVGTQSIVSGLVPGIYSVTIAGLGASGCGTAVASTTILTQPPSTVHIFKPYCGPEAYLNSLTAGTGHKWYQNTTLISGTLATLPNYTVTSPQNGAVYWVSYMTNQGCKDSIKFTLVSSPPGQMSVPPQGIKLICPGASNGTATINMTQANGAPLGYNTFSIVSTGTTAPYTASIGPVSQNVFTISGLSQGSYSVQTFDGACKYNTTFNVVPLIWNYTVSPITQSLCPGASIPAGITFTSPPLGGQYTYSWSPTNWLVGGNGGFQNTIITPTGIPNGQNITTVYTIVVTPTIAICPITKTLQVTGINPPTPTISAIPNLCNTFGPTQILVAPVNGTYTAAIPNLIGVSSGIITPSLATIGTNTFNFATNVWQCIKTSTASLHVSQFFTAALTSTVAPLCVTSTQVNLMNIVQQTNGTWSGPGVTGNAFSPAGFNNAPSTVVTLSYNTVSSPIAGVCDHASTRTISITNTLIPTIAPVQPLCTTDTPINMTVSPTGGGWSGSNISVGGVFVPANVINGGLQSVTYTVNVGPCFNIGGTQFIVGKVSSANIVTPLPELCITTPSLNLMSFVQSTVNGQWSPVSPISNLSNNIFTPPFPSPLNTGVYTLQYSTKSTPDVARCAQNKTATISVLNPVMPNISPAGPLCNKGEPIELSVNSTAGKWTTSSYLNADGVFSPSLAAVGNNAVQYVVGTPTCFVQHTRFISVEAFVSAEISTNFLPDLCNTGAAINLMPYAYNSTGTWIGNGISGTNFNPAAAGKGNFILTYTTASTPSGLCPDMSTVAVSVFSLQTPTITKIGPFCSLAEPVQLTADVQGGMYGGANTPGVNMQGLFIPGSAVIGDNIVNYSITSGPCVAYAQTTISVEKFVSADFHTIPPVYCHTDKPVNMNHFVVNPGYLWSGDGMVGNMFDPKNAKPGNNNIIVYQTYSSPNATLCPDKQEVRIKVVPLPPLNLVANKFDGCAPAEFLWNIASANMGEASWTPGDGSEKKQGLKEVTHIYTSPGIYSVQVNYSLEGCATQVEFANSFTVYAQPDADFEIPSEILISEPNLQVVNTTNPLGENTYTWKIDGAEAPSLDGKVNPEFPLAKLGRYNITLTAENIHGCTDEVTKTVEVKNDFNIYIPTSFSPNFDGLNDKFKPEFSPYGLDAKSFEMEIFDRWGHSIYRTTDFSKGWDGSVGNKGEPLKEGVYIYKIRYKDMDGNAYSKMGHVSMLK